MFNLIEHLNAFGDCVAVAIPNINCGGCCVFAAMVGERLANIVPVRVRVGSYAFEAMEIKHIGDVMAKTTNNSPLEWNSKGLHFGHVILEFDYEGKTWHFDTNGVTSAGPSTPDGCWTLIAGAIPVSVARELASYSNGWNTRFDRDYIPKLRLWVDVTFDEIESEMRAVEESV